MRVERWERWALAAILLLALVLRIIGLNAQLWYDEIFTLTHYVREPLAALLTDFSSLNNHMFYSLQAKLAVALFGESAWTLRLPALLFGMGSLVVLWQIGRDAAGRVPALLAVLLMAISYHHVWFTQNARGYTGLLFWTSLATLLFVRGLKAPSWRIWTGYGLCVAAAMYTHLSAGFFFAAHALVYAIVWLRGQRDIRPVYGFGVGGLVTAALHAPLFTQVLGAMHKVSTGKTSAAMAEWVNPLRTLQEITASLGSLGALAPVALVGALLLIVVGAAAMARRSGVMVAVYALSIPLALGILVTLHFRIWPRYFFVDIGFVFLCVAAGADVLCRWLTGVIGKPRWAPALFGLGVLVMTAASALLLVRNYTQPKQDFAAALALVAAGRAPGDSATSLGLASEPLRSYLAPDWPVVTSAAELAALQKHGGRMWIVTAFDDHVEPGQEDVLAQVQRDFDRVGSFDGTLGDGTVRVYRSKVTTEDRTEPPANTPLELPSR